MNTLNLNPFFQGISQIIGTSAAENAKIANELSTDFDSHFGLRVLNELDDEKFANVLQIVNQKGNGNLIDKLQKEFFEGMTPNQLLLCFEGALDDFFEALFKTYSISKEQEEKILALAERLDTEQR